MKIRFLLAMAFLVAGSSLSGWAQQQSPAFRVKHTPSDPAPKKVNPVGKMPGSSTTASAANSKDLAGIEHQTARTEGPTHAAGQKSYGSGAALKPVKDKPNPPINFGSTGSKSPGTVNQSANPYKGRLRQKHSSGH